MIVLLHGARAYGAVERYVEAIAGGVREETVLVHPGIPEFERLPVRGVELRDPPLSALVRLLRSLRPRLAHVTDVWPQALLAARLARVPRVLLTHHTPELPRRDNLAGRVWWRLGWATRPEVIYTSAADAERDGRRPRHVIPLGIDLDRFDGAEPALVGDRPLVGNVARLAPQKDHRTLVEAARLVPEAEFVVVGDGELREELERLAEGLRVTFLGARDDVPELLASFDVFAFPSLFEGLCLAVIEAQAAGVPVVATPVGGIRETVVDGETGLLVPTRDPPALAAAIRRLLEDRPAAEAMAIEARRRVRERFSTERMVEATLHLYGTPP
ncbi:MAG TPA: glycosyltransferase [Gaiellaceae bacterium]|jgi:glycosyltransferase involved in cell wall biosynthesis|nr:glycosyltransferase [Gaiellaceae bacterium]